MGLIDASNPRRFKPRKGVPTDDTVNPVKIDPYYNIGGDSAPYDRSPGTDQEPFDSERFGRDVSKLMDMVAGTSPAISAFNMATGGYNGMGPQMPAFGLNDAVADEIATAATNSGDFNPAGSAGNLDGIYAKGGKVGRKGLLDGDPPGPDNVIIGAKTGERVLTKAQYNALSPKARAEVDAAMKKSEKARKK